MIIFHMATSYLTLSDAVSSFLSLNQPCRTMQSVVGEKMLVCANNLKLSQIIGTHQAKKKSQEFAETS